MNSVKLNLTGLKTLQRNLADLKDSRAQVGLFPETAARVADKGRITENPGLGVIHELGKEEQHIPRRSFLKDPLENHLENEISGINWFDLIRKHGVVKTLGILGAVGEDIVLRSFVSRGDGKWPALHPRTIARKKRLKRSLAILIETAQMKKAIMSRVRRASA